jgi:hypothetical protein
MKCLSQGVMDEENSESVERPDAFDRICQLSRTVLSRLGIVSGGGRRCDRQMRQGHLDLTPDVLGDVL